MNKQTKILIILFICVLQMIVMVACSDSLSSNTNVRSGLSNEEIEYQIDDLLNEMSINDKAGQMVQAEQKSVSSKDVKDYGLGSVLSGGGNFPGNGTSEEWYEYVQKLQDAAMGRDLKIPILYGVDAVHGHDHLSNAVIFPHNIGLGAANDADLMHQMGTIVAEEIKASGIHWNFGPCVAVSKDPRWGRTYESISSDSNIVTELQTAYAMALQENGIVACAKHYIGDGGTTYGTGDSGYQIDQGDVIMTEDALREAFLPPYKSLVDAGVYTVMVSFSSFNGLKMHENRYLINDVLKDELGFDGFVISDWEGHVQIDKTTYEEKVATTINAGVDMLMEPNNWKNAIETIIWNVEQGNITEDRINEAVRRILRVKFKAGIFANAYPDANDQVGIDEHRMVAEKLVEKSAVLLKNDDVLPIKSGTSLLVIGPAADDIGVQCGGWTKSWQGQRDNGKLITGGTTLLDGLKSIAEENNITILTNKKDIEQADVVLIAIGEVPYAEGFGDSEDISIVGSKALPKNKEAIEFAKASNKPTIAVIMAGRNVMITEQVNDWDGLIMAYLPGTEGKGLANVLTGIAPFTGELPMPWYKTVDDIAKEQPELLFELGYGLKPKIN